MKTPPRTILVITLGAVALHTLLFVMVRPGRPADERRAGDAPATSYMSQEAGPANLSGDAVRVINSPVLFSLPSSMGFSRELGFNDVSTRLNTFSRLGQTEHFLPADSISRRPDSTFDSKEFMVASTTSTVPGLPVDIYETNLKRPSSRRVTISAELKERLVGGIVLPAALNKPVSKPWEAKASVRVAANGSVEHVFFDEPLEPELNVQVLRLLYSLNFRAGDDMMGRVEIYSPESSSAQEGAP